jgi:aminotransferase
MVKEYQKRRDIVFEGINSTSRLSCLKSEGTFYAFVNVKKLNMSSVKAMEFFLNEAGVATVPGTAYGASGEGYLRISFALEERDLIEGIDKIKTLVG